MISVKIDSRWIGLHGPSSRIWWIPERTDRHHGDQADPDPADGPVRQRAFGGGQLDEAKRKGGHRREGM
jgi:hypothetical protein